MITPQDLKQTLSSGLLSFPITDFDANGDFKAGTYIERLEWLAPYGATALFVAGGTGEFFSLTPEDYSKVVKTAVDTWGPVPAIDLMRRVKEQFDPERRLAPGRFVGGI